VNPFKYIKEKDMTLLLSNEASLIDWCYLSTHFQPAFVSIDIIEGEKMGLRILSGWDVIKRAIGIKLPETGHTNLCTSFKELYDQMYFKRPIVCFPQCARTNGRGVLNFPGSVIDMLYQAQSDSFKMHSVRLDYTFSYKSPYNTVDVSGYSHAFTLLSQFINMVSVQYYFDV